MSEKKGIKEFLELLIACLTVALMLFKRLRDGFQMDDLTAIVGEVMVSPEIRAGFEGIQEVPEEVKDMDVMEGLMVGKAIFEFVPKFVEVARMPNK